MFCFSYKNKKLFISNRVFLPKMVTRVGTRRTKTRQLMKKPYKRKGKLSLTRYFTKYNTGDKVVLKAEPAVQKGLYELRYHGKVGIVEGKQGRCYKVTIKDRKKPKTMIVHPVHLQRAK
jgi:large subunit ribosomal protein L21e